ncbi:hypothetical protein P4493_05390 [Bacillus thuringiensis]|jgi:hypothetical protein|uniref:Uncharacterized protein n=2 Tax=Bacillus thuringiensis TaxID=1428 RepID=A0A0B5N8V2_BACTU|nr:MULTISPECIES: hypothetical protein [Bacillus]EAO56181.1 hypothetical protein RBTH_07521 [Bacillus thuringiensis serovar israelensis ATCC 35646]MEC2534712.1 hypothetical protein [Bacillus cereus]MED1153570.1 hypothetical protein [Bacillus paranthracis]OUB09140.1 hypothetical protein BK708_31875 [Bacillus thuringiensis serovar yunnanensis]AJG74139.1 hypothetical protein BF38_5685 [Bacillus thuringiensis]
MDKQVITEELHVVEEDLIKVKLGLNKVDKYVEKLEDIQEYVGMLVEYLNCRLPKGTISAKDDTEEDYQELFLLTIITIDRGLQDLLDEIVETVEGKEDIKNLLVKSTIGIRKIMYKHSDLKSVKYALSHTLGSLKAVSFDTVTYEEILLNLLKLTDREYQYSAIQYETVEEEIFSTLDTLNTSLKGHVEGKLDGENKEHLDYGLGFIREVSLFLQAVLSK